MEANKTHRFCEKPAPLEKRVYKYSPEVGRLLHEALKLKHSEQFSLIFELVKQAKLGQEERNSLKNFVTQKAKEEKIEARASGQSSMVDPRATTQLPSLLPASQVSLIIRGDLVTDKSPLVIDMEKVIDRTHQPVAGDFAVVNSKGQLVFWAYIKQDNVCRFNTTLTGLTKEKIERGISPEMVRELLKKILRSNVIVGADLINDLKSLGYNKRDELPAGVTTEDIQNFYRDNNNEKIKLALLGEHFTGENFQQGTHSSIRDARMTLLCYKKMKTLQANGLSQFSCPDFDELRRESKAKRDKSKHVFDRCTCKVRPEKRKKKQNWTNSGNVDVEYFAE